MSIFEIHDSFPNQFNCTINDLSCNNVSTNNSFTLNKKALTLLKNNFRKSYREIVATLKKRNAKLEKTM